jgi:NADH-quinone oxidoreductase subunit F
MHRLLRHVDRPGSADIEAYLQGGGYRALAAALATPPASIIDEVITSGLRGRGGAGFPTGRKWQFAAAVEASPKILVCNADEGEPGTFKDRILLERNPHLLIEGMVISGHALQAEQGYIYLRREYPQARVCLEQAIGQAREHGVLGDDLLGTGVAFHLEVFQGAGAYICGEETALLESLEGRRGHPRRKPPFPVERGAWGRPTVVNNVETLCNVPIIVEIGGEAYSKIGPPGSPGPKLFCISGCVERPGVYEAPMGTSLRALIFEHAGGMRDGRRLKGVIPGGLSAPVLPASSIDCAMDFESVAEAGSLLGSGAVIVLDESVCMVKVAHRAMQFFRHESCGKCVPCREGTGWLERVLGRIEAGAGSADDVALINDVADAIEGRTFCPLGDGAAGVVRGVLRHFRHELIEHVERGGCRAAG